MGICENNDDLAVSLFVGAADFNVNDCDSAFRFIDVNQLTCDNAIESLTLFGMINTEVETDGKTFADICCQSCTQIQCTLDVDSSQMASGECTDGQESFEFCGKTQCITNPDCKYADFGLDDANDNFLGPMESFDDHYQMRTSGKCQGETMIHEISTDNHSGLCKTAADMLGATYKDFGAKKPSDMKALAKAKFPLGCSYNPNKMIVYYNPMNAGTTKYNYDASENKRAICSSIMKKMQLVFSLLHNHGDLTVKANGSGEMCIQEPGLFIAGPNFALLPPGVAAKPDRFSK